MLIDLAWLGLVGWAVEKNKLGAMEKAVGSYERALEGYVCMLGLQKLTPDSLMCRIVA